MLGYYTRVTYLVLFIVKVERDRDRRREREVTPITFKNPFREA